MCLSPTNPCYIFKFRLILINEPIYTDCLKFYKYNGLCFDFFFTKFTRCTVSFFGEQNYIHVIQCHWYVSSITYVASLSNKDKQKTIKKWGLGLSKKCSLKPASFKLTQTQLTSKSMPILYQSNFFAKQIR